MKVVYSASRNTLCWDNWFQIRVDEAKTGEPSDRDRIEAKKIRISIAKPLNVLRRGPVASLPFGIQEDLYVAIASVKYDQG